MVTVMIISAILKVKICVVVEIGRQDLAAQVRFDDGSLQSLDWTGGLI